jgi:radical SAM protein with 4Fe4S-binding SPASM domain
MAATLVNPFRGIYDMDTYKHPYNYPLAKFPYIIDIEATNQCNLDCLMCGRQIMTRNQGIMSLEIFTKIMDEASKEGCKGIRLIRWGEPLLNPNIFGMIGYAQEKKLLVHMTTNGILLTKEKIADIFKVHLDSMIFSFQGTTKDEYEKIRNNNMYAKLQKNIKLVISERKRLQVEYPYVTITTTILDETEKQIKEFYNKWEKVVDKVDHWYTSFFRIKDFPRAKALWERQRVIKAAQEKESARGKRCTEVMTKLSVNWNGDVTACCGDFNGELIVGDIKENSLKEIWVGKRLVKLREILSKGERSKIQFCSTCTSKF